MFAGALATNSYLVESRSGQGFLAGRTGRTNRTGTAADRPDESKIGRIRVL